MGGMLVLVKEAGWSVLRNGLSLSKTSFVEILGGSNKLGRSSSSSSPGESCLNSFSVSALVIFFLPVIVCLFVFIFVKVSFEFNSEYA